MLDDTCDTARSGAKDGRIGATKIGVETSLAGISVSCACKRGRAKRTYPSRPFQGRGKYSELTGGGRDKASLTSPSPSFSASTSSTASRSPDHPAEAAGPVTFSSTPLMGLIVLSSCSSLTGTVLFFRLLEAAAETVPLLTPLVVEPDAAVAPVGCSCPSGEARRAMIPSIISGLTLGSVTVVVPPRPDWRRGSLVVLEGAGTSARRVLDLAIMGGSSVDGDATANEDLFLLAIVR